MNQNEKIHNGMTPELNTSIELSDDELDSVAGGVSGEDLKAWWDAGYQGAPLCPQHGNRKAYMKSYRKDSMLHLECTVCGFIKVLS